MTITGLTCTLTQLTALLEGNARYTEHTFPGPLSMTPARRTVILSCVDPRVDPARILGLAEGDAAIIRNVGGRVTPALMHSMGMLQAIGRADTAVPAGGEAWTFIVLHHTDCGIIRLADRADLLATYFGISVEDVASRHVNDPHAAVADDIQRLTGTISPQFAIIGMVHDLNTGRVSVINPTS